VIALTRAGGGYIALTLLLGFAAVNTGNNLLYLAVATLLAVMSVSGILGWLNLKGLHLSLELPDELYATIPTLVTIRLANRKRYLPACILRVNLFGQTVTFPLLAGGEEAFRTLLPAFPARGWQELPAAAVCSPFPVGFFVRSWEEQRSVRRVCAFPRPLPGPVPGEGGEPSRGGMASTALRGAGGEIVKIADYTGVEPVRLVHWRLSARHGELKVKELADTSREPVVLEISQLPGGSLEERLGRATFLVNRLLREGRPVGLRVGSRLVGPGLSGNHRLRLLRELALYGTD
jgi:uncharacterized protein (DUF58 family)